MSLIPDFTVLGAGGWIGKQLCTYLENQGYVVYPVGRQTLNDWLSSENNPGRVINTIGLTADFRDQPHETCEAHVEIVSRILRRKNLERLVSLSSTRLYINSTQTDEKSNISVNSNDPGDIFSLSKLLGEALILQDPNPQLKVARISNVIGKNQPKDTFIGMLIDEYNKKGYAEILQPPDYGKDYIAITETLRLLTKISISSKNRIYNIASGQNISNQRIAEWLTQQGIEVRFKSVRKGHQSFPKINIENTQREFTTSPLDLSITKSINEA